MEDEFKSKKNLRLLTLYNSFLSGQIISKDNYVSEHQVTERTFERDIAEIRNFLSNIFSSREILYDKKSDVYFLSGNTIKYMDKMDAIVISKILLGSKVLRKDELNGLIQKILINVEPCEAKEIVSYLNKDFDFYESKTVMPILKMINDLNTVIESGCDIEYTNINGNKKIISPIKIELTNSSSILLACSKIEPLKYIKIDIAEIVSFKIQNTYYAKYIQEKYYKEREEQRNGN